MKNMQRQPQSAQPGGRGYLVLGYSSPGRVSSTTLAGLFCPLWVILRLSKGKLSEYILNFYPQWRTDIGRDFKPFTEAETGL
jgi:hypothetical protein